MRGYARRLVRSPSPGYPLVGNAGVRPIIDATPFEPGASADLVPANRIQRRLQREGIVDLGGIVDLLTAHNRPPQLVQAGYPALITALGVANKILLIPKNPNRQSLKICNPGPGGNITYSFDAPISLGGIGLGVPVPAGLFSEESNGSVSINGIWVWCDQATATLPIPVIGYEGVLSVAGNKA